MTKSIVIYGAGEYGKCFYEAFHNRYNIIFFVDNNEELWDTVYRGVPIKSKYALKSISLETEVVIASRKYRDEIGEDLKRFKGISYSNMDQFIINEQLKNDSKPRFILLNTHEGTNIGDYLINVAERYFLKEFCNVQNLVEISAGMICEERELLKKYINRNDILLISGGGYLGSLWLNYGEENVRQIIHDYPDNQIIILPQTLYFESSSEGERQKNLSAQIYNSHHCLTMCLRDRSSYDLANIIFKKEIKKLYTPDIALILDNKKCSSHRNGILTCFREDKEKVIGSDISKEILKYCLKAGETLNRMSMVSERVLYYNQQMKAVEDRLSMVKKSRVVITDRLHCMIMCAITGTPCIVFDNLSKKISGVYDWVKNNQYIVLAKEGDDWINKLKILTRQEREFSYMHDIIDENFKRLVEHIIGPIGKE